MVTVYLLAIDVGRRHVVRLDAERSPDRFNSGLLPVNGGYAVVVTPSQSALRDHHRQDYVGLQRGTHPVSRFHTRGRDHGHRGDRMTTNNGDSTTITGDASVQAAPLQTIADVLADMLRR